MTLEQYTLVAATHRKLEKAANGTSTQVVSCMINKWRTKINGKEVYNERNPPGMGGKKKRIEERRLLFVSSWKAFVTKH